MSQPLMNAVLLTGYGGPEKLVYSQVAIPSPQSDEVLIKVGACSVNNTDLNTRTGWYTVAQGFEAVLQDTAEVGVQSSTGWGGCTIQFPRIQGADIVGKVVALGTGVGSELLGQRVMVDPWVRANPNGAAQGSGTTEPQNPSGNQGGELSQAYRYVGSELDGGFAEYAAIPQSNVYVVDSPLTDAELASFPCAYSTAENMVVKGRVTNTDTVMITGASGGVGNALIQLCKLRGATVVAIASHSKQEFVRNLGADVVYDRHANLEQALSDQAISVWLDPVGGPLFPVLLKQLQVGGRYVTCGAIAGPLVELDLRELIYKDLEMMGATRMNVAVFQNLVDYLNRNCLKPVIAKTFPLSQINAAQQFFQSKVFCGKVVIIPEASTEQ